MSACRYDVIKKYKLLAECDGPLRIGNSFGNTEDILVHISSGEPFVQASSINGAMRDFCEREQGQEIAGILFGSSLSENVEPDGRLKLMDAAFDMQTLKMEYRPHVSIDRETGTVGSQRGSGQKFDLEYIGAGSQAELYLYLYEDSQNPIADKLEALLAAMKQGRILFGAKKSNGAGKLKLVNAEYKIYDMKTAQGRDAWRNEDCETAYESLVLAEDEQLTGAYYEICISGKTEGPVQVKGQAVSEFGESAADSQNMQNSKKEYIVPGSSFKGSIRNQMERIADYLGNHTVIDNSFGRMGVDQNDSYAGNLVFSDTVIGEREDNDKNELRNRIHIDKFTAGVFHGGKFTEKNACGSLEFRIAIRDNHSVQDAKASLGVLLLAIRDMACGLVGIGNGYANGKGIILVEQVLVKSRDAQVILRFDDGRMKLEGERSVIEEAIRAAAGSAR